tara:strand:+ start:397 stop:723 length:327 start_codon:yes stop_codon:yes gene_type:complete
VAGIAKRAMHMLFQNLLDRSTAFFTFVTTVAFEITATDTGPNVAEPVRVAGGGPALSKIFHRSFVVEQHRQCFIRQRYLCVVPAKRKKKNNNSKTPLETLKKIIVNAS